MTHVLNLGVHNMGTLRRVFLTNDEAEAETLQNQIQDIRSALKSMETRILSRQQDQLDELQQNQNQELRSALKSMKSRILRRQQDKLDEMEERFYDELTSLLELIEMKERVINLRIIYGDLTGIMIADRCLTERLNRLNIYLF